MNRVAARHVLFLAYHFPPLGGAGVQRSAQFVLRLPAHGFEPIVVTAPLSEGQVWPPSDPSLADGLPIDARIHRLSGPLDPKARAPLAHLRARYLMKSEFGQRWTRGCIDAGRQVARREPFDVILATMSPFSTAEAAAVLSQEFGVPWVADLRDPWALDEIEQYPSRWHRRIAVRNMGRCLATAAVIVANTPDAAEAMRTELPEVDPSRVVTITNGFDPADFAGPPPRKDSARFRIVHTGHLHTALGRRHQRTRPLRRLLGGERVPTDLLTRSHVVLVEALSRWQARDPRVAQDVEVLLAGHASPADREVVGGSPVAGIVRFVGYLAHEESVALLRSADLLFLPMHALPPGERARIVPGKTYEYLAARRPILGAVPEGDARDFIRASGLGSVCDPTDAEEMLNILEDHLAAYRSGSPRPDADDAFIARFDRAVLTEQLAAVFDRALSKADS